MASLPLVRSSLNSLHNNVFFSYLINSLTVRILLLPSSACQGLILKVLCHLSRDLFHFLIVTHFLLKRGRGNVGGYYEPQS